MKVVILAGGIGSRLGDDTAERPKPMVEIGGRPILWHIMKHLSHQGFNEFIIALGYRSEMIKRYFIDYAQVSRDMSINIPDSEIRYLYSNSEAWKVDLVDTGMTSNTAWRLKLLAEHLRDDRFLLTYGDGVSDVDVAKLLVEHRSAGAKATYNKAGQCVSSSLATVTAVHPPARYGALRLAGSRVQEFAEKRSDEAWVNGGYIIFEPSIFHHQAMLEAKVDTDLSSGVLARLAEKGQLSAYRHEGFWQGMDTARDKRILEEMWANGTAPWRVWE